MTKYLREIKCPSCGGMGAQDGVCMYCMQPNSSLTKLSKLIGHNDFESYYNNILNIISSGNILNKTENEILNILINGNAINHEPLLCNLVIKGVLLGKKVVDYENFKELIKRFCKNIMININNGRIEKYFPKCFIAKLEDTNGYAFDTDTITLDENRVKEFYNGMLAGLQTIFHELNHMKK